MQAVDAGKSMTNLAQTPADADYRSEVVFEELASTRNWLSRSDARARSSPQLPRKTCPALQRWLPRCSPRDAYGVPTAQVTEQMDQKCPGLPTVRSAPPTYSCQKTRANLRNPLFRRDNRYDGFVSRSLRRTPTTQRNLYHNEPLLADTHHFVLLTSF